MANVPRHNLQTLEALDVRRPGSDDAYDPALAELAAELAVSPEVDELYGRLQKLDATLAGVFQDVQPPPGLRERLLAAVAPVSSEDALSVRPRAAARAFGRRFGHWRWWLVVGGAAAAVLLAVAWFHEGPTPYTPGEAMAIAIERFTSEPSDEPLGKLVSAVTPPRAYPISDFIRWPAHTYWRGVRDLLDATGVAYDLRSADGGRATLYVLDCSLPGLSGTPPLRPAYGTANCSAAAWEENGLVYVVVVQGDAGAYQRFLNLPSGPLT